MPESIPSSRGTQRLLAKREHHSPVPRSVAIPRRQLSLLAITALLNTLLWSSLICVVIAIYQIAFDSDDLTNTPSGVLILTSALMTITYAIVHTIFSLKQRGWNSQRATSTKKSDYVAIRLVVSLCVLWILTTGWNMIMVARRPVCLPEQPNLQRWESGFTCYVSRVGIGLATIALVASLILFGMMAVIGRPFEAHLLGHASSQPMVHPDSPAPSFFIRGRRRSTSTPSVFTNADIETLDLDISRPSSVVHSSPSGRYSPNPDVFTSPFAPPPLPSAYIASQQGLYHQRTISPPPGFRQHPPLQPRASPFHPVSAYAPYSVPLQLSASAQRAMYPDTSAPYRPASPRSHPHIRSASLSQQLQYSRSNPSLTRPRRLSNAPSPSPLSASESSTPSPPSRNKRASAAQIAYALAHDEPIPGTEAINSRVLGHWRAFSAPDVSPPRARSQQTSQNSACMAKGWHPPRMRGDHRQTSIDGLVRRALADLANGVDSGRDSLDSRCGYGSDAGMGAQDEQRMSAEEGGLRSAYKMDAKDGNDGRRISVISRLPGDLRISKSAGYVG